MGKSRLLDAAATQAQASGMGVLTARGLEFERDFPFGVALQLLEPPLAAADPAQRAGLLAGAAAAAALFEGREVTGLADGVDHSYAFVHGLRRLAANLIARPGGDARPVLVAVDDAQWADVLSLRFLIRLAADLGTLPAAVVIAARDGEQGANASYLRKLATAARELRLGRLSPAAVAAVVGTAYPGAAPEFWQACARASGGNPFYLHEIVKAAQADGIPATARGAADIAGLVPESVLHSVLLRLARVPGDGSALATAAAILGDAAPLAQAAELAGLDEETAEQAADALALARILVPGEPLSFTHPLIGAAIRDDLPALACSRAHRQAAGLLAADGAPAEVVAAHLLACRPADDADAAVILRQAAQHAAVRGEYDAARRFLERALAERLSPGLQADLRLQLALAQAAVGVPDALALLTDALESVHDGRRRAQALHALARLQFARSDFPAAAEAIREALGQLGQADDPLARELLTDQMALAGIQPHLCPEATERLAALADGARRGRLPRETALLAQLASSMVASGEPAGQVREIARAAAQGISDDAFYGITAGFAVLALIHIDELDLASPLIEAAMERARRAGSLIGTGFASHWRAMLHYHRGALDQAITAGEDTLEVCRAGWDVCLPWVVSLLVRAHIERGDLGAAAQTLHLGEDTPERGLEGALLLEARGHLALARGEPAEALASLEAAGALTATDHGTAPPTMLPWRSAAALAAAQIGQRQRAADLVSAELDQARKIGARRTLGCTLRVAGLITEGRPGLALLAEAVAVLECSAAALERARALTDLGAACRRAGQFAAARQILHRASQAAHDLGATPLASRAREELRAAGGRRRSPRHHAGPAALTPTERRVAQLAADGLGTPEIARTLYVSPKTIEWHLDHVYRKLAIRSRHQLPAALSQ